MKIWGFLYSLLAISALFLYGRAQSAVVPDFGKIFFFAAFAVSSFNFGSLVLSRFSRTDNFNAPTRFCLFSGAGVVLLSLSLSAALAAGVFSRSSALLIIFAPVLAQIAITAARIYAPGRFSNPPETFGFEFVRSLAADIYSGLKNSSEKGLAYVAADAAIVFLALFLLVSSSLPQTSRDDLGANLELSRSYAEAGSFVYDGREHFFGRPQLMQPIYSAFIIFGLPTLASTVQVCFWLMAAVLIMNFPFERSFGGDPPESCRKICAVLMLANPQAMKLSASSGGEFAIAFFFLASLLSYPSAGFALSAVTAGGMLSLDYSALALFPALAACAAFCPAEEPGGGKRGLTAFCLVSFAAFSPQLFRNFYFTGNPFFPHLGDLFAGAKVSYPYAGEYYAFSDALARSGGWFLYFFRPFFGDSFELSVPLAVPFFALAYPGTTRDEGKVSGGDFSWFVSAALLLYFFFAYMALGAYIPVTVCLPFIYLIGARGLNTAFAGGAFFPASLAFAAIIAINASAGFSDFVSKAPLRYLAGLEGTDGYLEQNLGFWPCLREFNAAGDPGGRKKKLFMLYETRTFYASAPCGGNEAYEPFFEPPPASTTEVEAFWFASPSGVEKYFADRGVTHLLAGDGALKFFSGQIASAERKKVFEDFLASSASVIERKNGYALYEIRWPR